MGKNIYHEAFSVGQGFSLASPSPIWYRDLIIFYRKPEGLPYSIYAGLM
jgi:hypothetical protein